MSNSSVVSAAGEVPIFRPGDRVRVSDRSPIGHYRVPTYLRGKTGSIEAVIEPAVVDNEEEGYGRNAGSKRHYYRVAFAMTEIWPGLRRLAARRLAHRSLRDLAGKELGMSGTDHQHDHHAHAEISSSAAARLLRHHGDGHSRAAGREEIDRRRTKSAARSRFWIRAPRRSAPRSSRAPGSIRTFGRACWPTAAPPASRNSASPSTTTRS